MKLGTWILIGVCVHRRFYLPRFSRNLIAILTKMAVQLDRLNSYQVYERMVCKYFHQKKQQPCYKKKPFIRGHNNGRERKEESEDKNKWEPRERRRRRRRRKKKCAPPPALDSARGVRRTAACLSVQIHWGHFFGQITQTIENVLSGKL